jgi:serine/threonine protein kinase/tetratricopeptide (TPR) repeat protein
MEQSRLSAEAIFAVASKIESLEGREAYLAQVCGNDALLRKQVLALLEADPGMTTPSPAVVEPDATTDLGERPGTQVGPFKLLEQIGEGGMGVVYMADQQAPVRRRVALKIIKPGMDTRQVIARFEAERQALALMDHSNIARVLDAGATSTGRPYFVMELVRGVPITEYCDKNRLPVTERLGLFVQVCHAVQHAHQKGIIHRDLKPSNVLVTLVDGVPVPKVIDFGVAKATNQQLTDKTLFTNFTQMVGTPLYMSPEQAEMTSMDVDTRTDIYSLGVLLYELLTGTTPVDRKRLRDAPYDEVRRIIREEDPPSPSTRISTLGEQRTVTASRRSIDVRKLRQMLRGDLDWIVMKTLEKDRTHRYETANALARDVQRYLANEPVEARPPSTSYRFRKFARRNRALITTGALVASVLVLGLIVSAWQAIRATRAEGRAEVARANEAEQRKAAEASRSVAEEAARREAQANVQANEEAERARTEAEKAQQVAAFLAAMFEESAPIELAGMRFMTSEDRKPDAAAAAREILERGSRRVTTELKSQPLVQAALKDTMGNVYLGLADLERAETLLQEAYALRKARLPPEHPDLAASAHSLGILRGQQRRHDESTDLLRQALVARRASLGDDNALTDKSRWALALSLSLFSPDAKAREEATELTRQTVAWHRAHMGTAHTETAFAILSLAGCLLGTGKNQEAATLVLEATPVLLNDPRTKSLGVAISQLVQGQVAEQMFNTTQDPKAIEARRAAIIAAARKSIAACRESPGREHPIVLAIEAGSVWMLRGAADSSRSTRDGTVEPLFREAVEAAEAIRRVNPDIARPVLAGCLIDLASYLYDNPSASLSQVLERYQQAVPLIEMLCTQNASDSMRLQALSAVFVRAGRLAVSLGKTADAELFFRSGAEVYSTLITHRPDYLYYQQMQRSCYEELADVLCGDGKYRDAEELFDKALVIDEGVVAQSKTTGISERRAQLCAKLALVRLPQGKRLEADEALHKAIDLITDDANKMNEVVWALVVSPSVPLPDYEPLLALMKRFGATVDHSSLMLNTQSVALYRAGRWQEAIDVARRSQEIDGTAHISANGFVLAMAYTKLEKPELARKWYNVASHWGAMTSSRKRVLLDLRAEAAKTILVTPEPLVPVPNTPENRDMLTEELASVDPDAAWIPAWRGTRAAEAGQWALAAEHFVKATTVPKTALNYFTFASLAQLQNNDAAGYRQTCDAILKRPQSEAPLDTFWTTWTCVLADRAIDDWSSQLELARKCSQAEPNDFDYKLVLAAATYRAGRTEDTLKELTAAMRMFSKRAESRLTTAHARYFLAMAHHRLGQSDEAQRQLSDARAAAKALVGSDMTWNRRATLELLDREAAALIEGKTTATPAEKDQPAEAAAGGPS